MLAKHVTVLVRRDMAEVIPTTVFEHEVEVLKDIHGDGNVEVIDSLADVDPVEIDSGEEADRLMSTYGQMDGGQFYAERVFGRGGRGIEAYAHKPAKKTAKKVADAPADPDEA